MSKTNDTSTLGTQDVELFTLDPNGANTFSVRKLRDDELENVSGGINVKYSLFLPDGSPC